ncbi:metallophosphoesterase family protein [Desulfobacca acetoxidans]|nr:serine/threonine protein phosphatase [Desulfobacterales bacterium]
MIYAIGDIHGCRQHLSDLLSLVKPDLEHHKLVFIGDYIDRGPDSRGVVDDIIDLKKKYNPENIICLMGNHERMFLNFLDGREELFFLYNGGAATAVSYWGPHWEQQPHPLPAAHQKFFEELRLIYETPDYIFVHGGLKPGIPLEQQQEEDLLWIRGEFINSLEDFGRRVVFGHTPMRAPLIMPNKIGIDTGAVYGNKLTCVLLPEEIFFSVP